jgi:hypothetical protein
MKVTMPQILGAAVLAGSFLLPISAHADTLNQRLANQHQRIQAGFRNDSLTRHEQYSVDARDARVRYQIDRDRSRDHGYLTYGEHRRLNRELNGDSRAIYRDKHNDINR